MRWSWPSFAGGAAFGALLVLLLITATRGPDDGRTPRPSGGTDAGAAETHAPGSAAVPDGAEPAEAGSAPSAAEPRTPDATPSRARERVHVTPPVRLPTEAEWERAATPPRIDPSFSSFVVDSDGLRVRGGITVVTAADGTFRISFGQAQPRDGLSVDEANAAADAHSGAGGRADERAVRDLLASERYVDRAAGLALAARRRPPLLDALLAAARDREYPALRMTALSLAHGVASETREVREVVLDATRDEQRDVRERAISLLSSYGAAGATRAGELLASGDYVQAVLHSLVIAVVRGGRAGDVLAGALPRGAALALAGRVLHETDTTDPMARAEAYSIASLVRTHLRNADTGETATFFAGAASSGFGDVLAAVAGDAAVPGDVRLAAVSAALGQEATRPHGLRAFVGLIDDVTVSADTFLEALTSLDAVHLSDDAVRSAIRRVASSHGNPWVRSTAERRLRDAGYLVGTGLVIHSAVYGANGKDVDVTGKLRSGITGGKLVVAASNDLAGDPIEGVTKQLRVEYSVDGVRRVRTVVEGQTLVLP